MYQFSHFMVSKNGSVGLSDGACWHSMLVHDFNSSVHEFKYIHILRQHRCTVNMRGDDQHEYEASLVNVIR